MHKKDLFLPDLENKLFKTRMASSSPRIGMAHLHNNIHSSILTQSFFEIKLK